MLSWFRQIDSAKTIGEVLSIARDYIATWTPEELARLPQPCRPGRMRDEADLEHLHGILVEEYRHNRSAGEDLAALQRLTSFVVRASVRVAQLHSDAPGTGGGDDLPRPHKRSGAPRER